MKVPEPKTGLRTTEFWATVLTALLPTLTLIFHRDFSAQVETWATAAAGIATVIYIVSRALVKTAYARTEPTAQDARPPRSADTPPALHDGSMEALTAKADALIAEIRQFEQQVLASGDRLRI